MRITRDKALAVTAHCRVHGFKYVGQGQYPNTIKAAIRAGTKAPSGVRVHFPRDWIAYSSRHDPMLQENNRVYVLWMGEPVPDVKQACAYLQSVTREKEIYVVRCTQRTCDEHYHGPGG